MEAEASEKRRLTVDWLHRHYLSTMEFMPNENRIVLRGVGTVTVHKELYQTTARSGGFYLSYKQFMACMKPAAVACVAAQHGASEDKKHKVRVSRSARHSNFPMCTTCDNTVSAYIKEGSNPLADPKDVAKAKEEMLDHQRKFAADRTCARSMRYAAHDALSCSDLVRVRRQVWFLLSTLLSAASVVAGPSNVDLSESGGGPESGGARRVGTLYLPPTAERYTATCTEALHLQR
mgnify:CR=1 FL=1